MTTLQRTDATTLTLPDAVADPSVPRVASSLQAARAALAAATTDYLAIPEAAVTKRWLWNDRDHGDGVRYGIYRGAEVIEVAAAQMEAALASAPMRAPGAIRGSAATVARWALQGRLADLDDGLLDRVAKDGEWTIRQVMAHTIEGQRSYGWFTRWWLTQPLGDDRSARVTDEAEAVSQRDLPSIDAEGAGTLSEIRARFDDVLDEWALRYAELDATALAAPATWSGIPVDIDFRLGRWASHIREHTVQLDKTLDWLGYTPSEPARIVRDLHAAWGRLEASIFPVTPVGTEAAVAAILERYAQTLTAEAASAREAAEA